MTIDIISAAQADHKTTERRNTTWTRSLDERLLAMRAEGVPYKEIAEELGVVTGNAVRERYKRLQSPEPIWRWKFMNAEEREAYIRKANAKGRSFQSMAKSLGCAPSTISVFVNERNMKGIEVSHGSDRFRTHRCWHLSPDDPEHVEFIQAQDARFCKRMAEVGGSF